MGLRAARLEQPALPLLPPVPPARPLVARLSHGVVAVAASSSTGAQNRGDGAAVQLLSAEHGAEQSRAEPSRC